MSHVPEITNVTKWFRTIKVTRLKMQKTAHKSSIEAGLCEL